MNISDDKVDYIVEELKAISKSFGEIEHDMNTFNKFMIDSNDAYIKIKMYIEQVHTNIMELSERVTRLELR